MIGAVSLDCLYGKGRGQFRATPSRARRETAVTPPRTKAPVWPCRRCHKLRPLFRDGHCRTCWSDRKKR